MRKLLLAMFIGCISIASAQPQILDGVMAIVGKDVILLSDIEQNMIQLKSQGLPTPEGTRCRIFQDQLFEKVLTHHAELDSLIVTEAEVDDVIKRRLDYFIQQIGSKEALEEYYKKSLLELREELREPIYNQLLAKKMQGQITGGVKVSPQEVKDFFANIPKDSLPLINTEVELSQIVKIPEVPQAAKDAAREKLQEFRERIISGDNFATIARLYSEDPGSAKNGGKYTGIKRGQFVKEFEAAVFSLDEMELSQVFETEYGFHLAQLLSRKGELIDVRHILIKAKVPAESIAAARTALDSIRTAILNGEMTFEEAAMEHSEDKQSKMNKGIMINPATADTRFEVTELDRNLYFSIEDLEPGELSLPVFWQKPDGSQAFRLVKLKSRTEPHRADLKRDYNRVKNVALSIKQRDLIEEWLDEKLKITYVKVNNDYIDCELENKWLQHSND